jgi:hypothetical protein
MSLYEDVNRVFIDPEDSTQDEIVESLQRMISSGTWGLEGHTGRTMMDAIESGHCVLGPRPARDYWGNTIPARGQVKSGTLGSIAYANNLRRERGDKLITGSYLRRVEKGIR